MTVPDRERELERLLATVETLDERGKSLAGNLRKLVGDVHSIKGSVDEIGRTFRLIRRWGRWAFRMAGFLAVTVAAAAITYLVEISLGG